MYPRSTPYRRSRSSSLRGRTLLLLEALEDKILPAAPAILNLQVVNTTNQMMQVSGRVAHEQPATVTIELAGMLEGSTQPNGNGDFLMTVEATDLGNFTATATDQENLSSEPWSAVASSDVPSIAHFRAALAYGNTWNFTGHVDDESPTATSVAFGGLNALQGQGITPDANGDFVFSIELPVGETGVATARATDCWGQDSRQVYELLGGSSAVAPPITSLHVLNTNGHTVVVTGTVDAEDPSTATVDITGVVDGSANVAPDGSFSFTAEASSLGTITVTASDDSGADSDPVDIEVTSQVPRFIALDVDQSDEYSTVVTGFILDESPAGVVIELVCVQALIGTTTTVNADGSFCFTLAMGANELTALRVEATDCWGLTSDEAGIWDTPTAPTAPTIVSMEVVNTTGQTIQVTGTVAADFPTMTTISFDGVLSGSVQGNADGTFSFTVQASELGNFTATASYCELFASDAENGETTSSAPVIDSFTCVMNSDDTWTISGHVADESPDTLTLTLAGPETLNGVTLTPEADGSFTFTIELNSLALSLTGQAADAWGQTSDVTNCANLTTPPPAITGLTVVNTSGHDFCITGMAAAYTPWVLVSFGGVVSGELVSTNSDGSFSMYLTAAALGTVTVSAIDNLNQMTQSSAEATSAIPTVSDFVAVHNYGTTWTFSGQVWDETRHTTTLTLGGNSHINGQVITVNSDGSFEATFDLESNISGTITARATDCWGLQSDLAYYLI